MVFQADTRLPGEGGTAARKQECLRRIDAGEISEAEAMRRFVISAEELATWRAGLDARGWRGLQVTRIQEARHG